MSNSHTVNLNDAVRFKLLPRGEQIWRDYWHMYPAGVDPLTAIPADTDGWREALLWELAAVFGPHFGAGGDLMIETTIQIPVVEHSSHWNDAAQRGLLLTTEVDAVK